jgi:hypothetical protein
MKNSQQMVPITEISSFRGEKIGKPQASQAAIGIENWSLNSSEGYGR